MRPRRVGVNSVCGSVRKDAPDNFTLLVASAETRDQATHEIEILNKKAKLTIEYGDFAESLQKAVAALTEVLAAHRCQPDVC